LRYPLLVAQIACIASLFWSGSWRGYRALCGLLGAGIVASALYSTDGAGYSWIAGPVLVFRFLVTLEVSRRQTEHFCYWTSLAGASFILATFYTASVWSSPLDTFIEFRRLMQIWCAAYFVVVQAFWISQRFWWRSLPNWVAVWYGFTLVNHGAVSLASSLDRWTWLTWWRAAGWSWAVEALCWGLLALTFTVYRRDRGAKKFAPRGRLTAAWWPRL
jgi:hypothetical protein